MPPRVRKPRPKAVSVDTDKELDAQLAEYVPQVIDPGYDGHLLRIAGLPWAEVAARIGASSARSAMQSVSKYLQQAARSQSAVQQQEALQTQLDRYETILRYWWDAATVGVEVTLENGQTTRHPDKEAAFVVLRTMERMDRLQKLADSDVTVTKETLVISADPAEYIKQLKEVVAERTSANGHS